ncbi:uncharacterized protein LOC131952346 [Physella acuta]|uniref:uncharacterized protein LOC131952346 n=1 Tax=Physella acuta TaxID=109671 RepID=UPI0027DBFB4F|nr:uncharacterized protein LOC131952346 [Physella acuta]
MEMEISFDNAIKSYKDDFVRFSVGNRKEQVTHHEVRNLKLEVNNVDWKEIRNLTEKGESTQVHIKGQQKNLYGQVTSEHDLDTLKSVVIKEGVLKGLENIEVTMELPLPEDVQKFLGQTVTIDPRKQENKLENKTKVTLTSGTEHVSNAHGATAQIITSVRKYEGEFSCEVYPSGNVLLFDGDRARSSPELKEVIAKCPTGFKTNGSDFYWIMKGKVNFTWEVDHGHDWKHNEGKM